MKNETNKKLSIILSTIFYTFLALTIVLNIIILIQAYDPCRISNTACEFGWAYKLTMTPTFINILWIENIIAIIISLIFTIMSIIDKKVSKIIIGIVGIIITTVVWTSLFGALDIYWGL